MLLRCFFAGYILKKMKIDLHVHTQEISPCGKMPLTEVIDRYRSAGYDLIVITNHFSRKAAEAKGLSPAEFHRAFYETVTAAQEYGKKSGLRILGAHELRFDSAANDYLVFGMTETQCRDAEKTFAMTPAEFSSFARKNDILFYQAHPFRDGMTVIEPSLLSGIEVLNTHPRHDSRNDIALAWAEKYGLKKIAGSDCHRPEDVAGCAILTDFDVKNMDDLVHVLKNNLFTIWEKK